MPVIIIGPSVLSASLFGASSRPFIVGEVHCTGSETELLECSHSSIGDHFCRGFFSTVAYGVPIYWVWYVPKPSPAPQYTHTTVLLSNTVHAKLYICIIV